MAVDLERVREGMQAQRKGAPYIPHSAAGAVGGDTITLNVEKATADPKGWGYRQRWLTEGEAPPARRSGTIISIGS